MRWLVWLGNIMEMYRTTNPGMTVRPRPWPRRVASSTELESIKWHSGRVPLFKIHIQHSGTSKPSKMRRSFLRFNRIHFLRVEYAPWSIEGPLLNSNLSDFQFIFIQLAHNKMLDQSQSLHNRID